MVDLPETSLTLALHGTPASPGIAIGRAIVLRPNELAFERTTLPPRRAAIEVRRLARAVRTSLAQLRALRRGLPADGSPDHLHILDAHALMLQDALLVGRASERIPEEAIGAEWAIERTVEELRERFGALGDPLLRERMSDVEFVAQRVLRNLLGQGGDRGADLWPNRIVVARTMSPAETAQMRQSGVLGLVTDAGSRTSHVAIIARALELPAVVGLHDASSRIASGDTVILDGREGLVLVNPGRGELDRYRHRRVRAGERARALLRNRGLASVTPDGVDVRLLSNIDFLEEAKTTLEVGGQGIGLFRTEFLYLNRPDLPSEEEQLACYLRLATRMAPHVVTIRTVDLGADKLADAVACPTPRAGMGGLRAIRLCLRREDLFRAQLRALLRASVAGNLRILLPFVTCVGEVVRVRAILAELTEALRAEGHAVADHVPLGAMIETPAAAQIADLLAPHVDFFSIGTNDLIQYTLAVARDNDEAAHLYHPLHPAVLRTIRTAVTAARAANRPVAVCGEMASEPLHALVLLGLGLRELSMVPRAIPHVKELVRRVPMSEAERIAGELFALPTSRDVEAHAWKRARRWLAKRG